LAKNILEEKENQSTSQATKRKHELDKRIKQEIRCLLIPVASYQLQMGAIRASLSVLGGVSSAMIVSM